MEKSQGEIAYNWFYSDKRLLKLLKLLKAGKAQLFLTGYSLDMLTLRPEICTLLMIKDAEWMKQQLTTNWEFLTPQQMWENKTPALLPVDILGTDSEIVSELSTIPGTFPPTGAASFWLGIDLVRQILTKG